MRKTKAAACPALPAAAYIRLSREDGDKAESDSVGNQRKIIRDFIEDSGDLALFAEYVDDGWSGTSFKRPAFERMIGEIEAGRIRCVVVKDLSRFGRDYIDTGHFLERYFPERGVRFISIADGIDSGRQAYDLLLPIKNIFNEQYARDISRKIHAVVETKQRSGEFIGAFACYGYQKSRADKNKLVVDGQAAQVVREIFSLFLEGKGKNTIARMLNDRKIPCPSEYKRLNGENYRNGGKLPGTSYWTYSTVNKILHSEMYLGNMVQGRRTQQMRRRARQVERENWIVVEGTHEPIIDRETWERTRRLLSARYAPLAPGKGENVFAGLIKCGDCGRALVRKGRDGYACGTYVRAGKDYCTPHRIGRRQLEGLLIGELARVVKQEREDGRLEELFKRSKSGARAEKKKGEEKSAGERAAKEKGAEERAAGERELLRLRRLRQGIYEDYRDGLLSREEFLEYKKDYERREAAIEGIYGLWRTGKEKKTQGEETEEREQGGKQEMEEEGQREREREMEEGGQREGEQEMEEEGQGEGEREMEEEGQGEGEQRKREEGQGVKAQSGEEAREMEKQREGTQEGTGKNCRQAVRLPGAEDIFVSVSDAALRRIAVELIEEIRVYGNGDTELVCRY